MPYILPWDITLTFFSMAMLLAISPGPDNIFVLTQAALYGRKAGAATALGMTTGLFAHISAVAFGVAVIFKTSEAAFTTLKLVGALYLFYLAWKAFRSTALHAGGEAKPFAGYAALYRRGIIMNMTNPKVTLFFLALLPQFADPARGPVSLQILLLGLLVQLSTVIVFGGIAFLGGSLAAKVNASPRAQMGINRLAGCIFAGLAIFLLLAQRTSALNL